MPFKDVSRRRQYMRDYARRRRGSHSLQVIQSVDPDVTLPPTESARGLLRILGGCIQDILRSRADPLMKGRAVAYVVSIALRAVETTDLESRLAALEEKILRGGTDDEHEGES